MFEQTFKNIEDILHKDTSKVFWIKIFITFVNVETRTHPKKRPIPRGLLGGGFRKAL